MGILLHKGGQIVEKPELDLVPLPKATDSYTPVSHFHLAERIKTIATDLLTDYAIIGETYALARNGNQLFALLNFKAPQTDRMALSIAYRNSYDRSMSIGLAIGANVFVCDNLALSGEIAVMKKHRPDDLKYLQKKQYEPPKPIKIDDLLKLEKELIRNRL